MSNLDILRTAFRKDRRLPHLDLSHLAGELQTWLQSHPHCNFLHPCVIEGQAAIVCQSQLSISEVEAYTELLKITKRHHLLLKEDRRRGQSSTEHNRRAHTVAVLSLCLGLASAPSYSRQDVALVASDFQQDTVAAVSSGHWMDVQPAEQSGKKIFRFRKMNPPAAAEVLAAARKKSGWIKADSFGYAKIKQFLKQAYRRQPGDPSFVSADLATMADYYAKYPAVIELFKMLGSHNIRLYYKKSHWQAQPLGTTASVDQVNIYFDTRLSARLRIQHHCEDNPACTLSPADALLHELLHAKLMIVNSHEFVAQGGMEPTLYLFEHEREVIAAEKILYHSMSNHDGLLRPLRNRHEGVLYPVDCVLCFASRKNGEDDHKQSIAGLYSKGLPGKYFSLK